MRVGSRGEGLAWPRLPSRAQPQRNADEPPAPAHDRTNGPDRGKWLRHRDLEGFPECFSGFREGLESVATTGLWREAPGGTAGHHWCVRTNHRHVASLSDCDAYAVPDRPDGFTGFSSVIAGVLRVCGHNLDSPPYPPREQALQPVPSAGHSPRAVGVGLAPTPPLEPTPPPSARWHAAGSGTRAPPCRRSGPQPLGPTLSGAGSKGLLQPAHTGHRTPPPRSRPCGAGASSSCPSSVRVLRSPRLSQRRGRLLELHPMPYPARWYAPGVIG